MASSTLLHIAWPLTLGLSFLAGGMIISNEPTTENSKDDNQTSKVSLRNSSPNGSTNESSTAINRRSSAIRSSIGKVGYAKSHDIKEIFSTSDPLKRMTKFLHMIDKLGPGDFEQIVVDFRKLGGTTTSRKTEYRILLNAWAKINPEGALVDARKYGESPFEYFDILSTWAGYAPDAAIQWIKLNPKSDFTTQHFVSIIRGITQTNPERATDMLQELQGRDRQAGIAIILKHVNKLGAEKSIAWLATIKDEQLHTLAAKMLASSLVAQDPQATLNWLQTFPADTQKNVYARSIARAWIPLDLNKAVEWTSSLEGKTRSNTAQLIISHYASKDPNKAATWMKTMSADPDYKRIVSSFIHATEIAHPEIALANLDQLGDDRLRKRTRQSILRDWAAIDKTAATQWMQNNNIDPAAQEKALSSAAKVTNRGRW